MSDETLFEYFKHLPALEEMICVTQQNIEYASPKITVIGIQRALKYGEHLTVLSVDMRELTMNQDEFKSVLNLAKLGRVKVIINLENGRINVTTELMKANWKWLEVQLEVNDGNSLSGYQPEIKFEIFHGIHRLYV